MPPQLPGRTVLLIDDEAVRSSIEFALGVEGIEVIRLDSLAGIDAVDVASCGCMILDRGSASVDAIGPLLLAGFAGSPIIVLATAPSLTFRRACHDLGAVIVEKPLLRDELVATIRRLAFERGSQP